MLQRGCPDTTSFCKKNVPFLLTLYLYPGGWQSQKLCSNCALLEHGIHNCLKPSAPFLYVLKKWEGQQLPGQLFYVVDLSKHMVDATTNWFVTRLQHQPTLHCLPKNMHISNVMCCCNKCYLDSHKACAKFKIGTFSIFGDINGSYCHGNKKGSKSIIPLPTLYFYATGHTNGQGYHTRIPLLKLKQRHSLGISILDKDSNHVFVVSQKLKSKQHCNNFNRKTRKERIVGHHLYPQWGK